MHKRKFVQLTKLMKIKRYKKDVVIKNSRKIGKIFYGLIFVVLIAIFAVIAISTVKLPGNYKFLVVESGSMEPAIKKGAVVIIRPQKDYKINDIITVAESANPKVSLTHRIVGIEKSDGNTSFITKGDSNNAPDTEKRLKQNVLGSVASSVPYIGYLVAFAKTKEGLIFLIVIPVTMIIYSELINIKNEFKKLIEERNKKKLDLKEKDYMGLEGEKIKFENV